jgi:Cu-Zn family superoxide dismutase
MGFNEYLLPGERVLPEGIVVGPDADFYTGSSADGTIYHCRLDEPEAQVWLEAGEDGRDSALGMAIHNETKLVICGGRTGLVWVYEIASGQLLSRLMTDGFPNDVCVVGNTMYVTDSAQPVLHYGPVGGELTTLDMSPAGPDAYLNGIVATPDAILVAAQGTEMLWRVDLATGAVSKLADGFGADGMLLVGDTLYGLCNEGTSIDDAVFFLAGVRLNADATRAQPLGRFVDPRFDTPTTLDTDGERFLIVNAQFAKGAAAAPPFQVIAVSSTLTLT